MFAGQRRSEKLELTSPNDLVRRKASLRAQALERRAGISAAYGRKAAEIVATAGLVLVILLGLRAAPAAVPALVGLYIGAAYWFTSSTSFANPAVTLARSLSDTFAGIAPMSVPLFVTAQFLGAIAAVGFFTWLLREVACDDR